jgi:DNA-binding GntR family transcriptional regulator
VNKQKFSVVPDGSDSLPDFVYGQLRSAIRNQELKPGDRLREVELAERLGVSRTPVREALKRLEADGLTQLAPPRGFVVTELTHRRVMELYAMREILAGVAARFAAEQAAPMEIQTLQELVAQQGTAKDPSAAARLNDRLREAITSAAHNEFLTRATNSLNDALELLGTTTYSMPGRIESGLKENRKIVEAIARRNGAVAEETARLHVRNAAKLRVQMLFGNNSG